MNKKEKYINYVVDDLISNTEIYYDQEIIKLPFLTHLIIFFHFFPPLPPFFSIFSNHVRKVYGAHSEEIEIIWDLYKQRINELINNE